MTEQPAIFEVISPNGDRYRIWGNGETDGFPPSSIIINRIPHALAEAAKRSEVGK